jgi:hypothetical protein
VLNHRAAEDEASDEEEDQRVGERRERFGRVGDSEQNRLRGDS